MIREPPRRQQRFGGRRRPGYRGAVPQDPSQAIERDPTATRLVHRTKDGAPGAPADDVLAVEAPLEIRLDDAPVAVVMRTPGADFELAAGFLFSEGLVTAPDDVAGISWCREAGQAGPTNVVSVATPDRRGPRVVGDRRRVVTTTSACGLCGRVTLDEVHRRLAPLSPPPPLSLADLESAQAALRAAQPHFADTGSVHGAALLDTQGALVAAFEDVGRHNAVDKCVGRMLLQERVPLAGHLLAVSGRVSFEIVQKAAVAGIPAVCAVGGATSLAVDLARETGMLLAGFVRDGRATVYAGALGARGGSQGD